MSSLITFDVSYVIETIGKQAGLDVICDGIDDQCYGVVITSIQPFAQFLQKHKAPYNFQIIDRPDGSILIKRRVINTGLVIDYQLSQADCILRDPTQPAIKFTRADPLTLPREVEVQYVDPDRLYATNTQVARHQGARIFATRASSTAKGASKSYHGRTSTQIDFIVNADQAMAIAQDLLYRDWTQQLTAAFEHPDISIEPGDVFALTCDQGVYTMLVQTSTLTKERTNQIVALALLTSSVISVPGGQADPFNPNAPSTSTFSAAGAALVQFQSPTSVGTAGFSGASAPTFASQSVGGSVLTSAGAGALIATDRAIVNAVATAAGAGSVAAVGQRLVPFSIGNVAKNEALTGSSGTVTISVSAGSVLLIKVGTTALSGAGAPKTVSSVTSTNLTFAKRSSKTHHDVNIGVGALWQDAEVWWAFSSGALTSEVVTVTLSGAPDTGTIGAVECQGVTNPSSPWDANVALPAVNDGDNVAATITGISTTSAAPVGLFFSWSSGPLPPTPTGFTQADIAEDLGSNSNNEQRLSYQKFSSGLSGVTWTASGSSRNWIVIGDAFA